jgi:steroid 5-alpha reductase family enzyme
MAVLNLVFIAPFQNYLLLLMVSPIYVASMISPRNLSLTTIDWTAIVLHLSLLFIEVVADEQQYVFQTQKYALLDYLKPSELKGDYKLGFLWNSGLFQYSRHPNFFAEISMWWVIYLFSVAAVQQTGLSITSSLLNWTLMGPIVLTGLFQGSTWLTEVRVRHIHKKRKKKRQFEPKA